VGRAEEVEVERIALCRWRLKRAWRFENAVNLAARRDFVGAEMKYQAEYCKEKDKQEEAAIAELESTKNEIEETGQMSEELKQRINSTMPGLEGLWWLFGKGAEQLMERPWLAKLVRNATSKEQSFTRDFCTVTMAISFLKQLALQRNANVIETAVGQHAIPNPEALDRILRYETTIERYLCQAMERLDHLQRRRRGQFDQPAVRVHLS